MFGISENVLEGAAIFAVVAVAGWVLWRDFRKGVVRPEGIQPIYRDKNPAAFWFAIVFLAGIFGLVLVSSGMMLMGK